MAMTTIEQLPAPPATVLPAPPQGLAPPPPASSTSAPAPASRAKRSYAQSLSESAKDLLSGRFGESSTGRRCAEYAPTLEELRSTSFSDYVREELLGARRVDYAAAAAAHPAAPSEPDGGGAVSLPPTPGGASAGMSTRSRSRAASAKASLDADPQARQQPAARRPLRYEMHELKLRDGMAKVTLPAGFWSKMDPTGRGRHWAKGSKLGDVMIPSPIKQALSGMGGVYEYTLVEQPPVSVSDFRDQADAYRKRQVGREFDTDDSDDFCNDLARRFWRRLGPTMEPSTYGADMEGSLFRDAPACGWNVDRLESCLSLLRADAPGGDRDDEVFHLPGVTSAYLYFGMWASAFAAHTEDMNLLSINYLHAGAPKYWYAVAEEDAARFESLAGSHFASQSAECSEFLRHKQCVLSPAILKKAGIRFTTCVQRPGDAMITFPGSYHFGFNTGFNVAESTNFGVPEWVPYGEKAGICLCHPHSVRIQMDRLKSLLNDYDNDICVRASAGKPEVTYTQWAKQEAKRRKCEEANASDDGSEEGGGSFVLPTKLNATIAVEVTKEQITRTRKSSKKRSVKKLEFEQWRLAKRARPSAFVTGTDVICAIESSDDRSDFETFLGVIVKQVDGYVRVHLRGLAKTEDLWLKQDSPNLLLDAGLMPEENSRLNESGKVIVSASKRQK